MNANPPMVYRTNDVNFIAPPPVGPYSVLSLPAYWRALNFITTNMASFPRSVRRDREVIDAHPLAPILRRRPNGYQTPMQFWRTFYYHVTHTGNAYAEVKRTPTGRPASLHNLLPEQVLPARVDDGQGDGPQQFYVVGEGSARRVIAGPDVLHMSGLAYDGMCGTDPCLLFAETFLRARVLDRFTTRYFMRGTFIQGSIEIPGTATDEQVAEIQNTIATHFGAAAGTKNVIVLSGGASLKNNAVSPQDSQLDKQSAQSTKAIAQIMGLPPQFLYEFGESKYNNAIEAMGQDVVRFTFRPLIEMIEEELSAKLLTEAELDQGLAIYVNPDALLRGDTAAVNASAISTVNAGLRSENEGRELLGLPADPDPEADKRRKLGDTAPVPRDGSAGPQQSSAARPHARAFAIVNPVLAAAVARVEAKTANAVEAAVGRTGDDRTRWGNAFAEGQARYVADALAPVAAALAAAGGPALPVDVIAQRYAADVRARVAGVTAKGLAAVVAAALTSQEPDAQ